MMKFPYYHVYLLATYLFTFCLADTVVYTSGDHKLTLVNNDNGFSGTTRQNVINTFFNVVPKMNTHFGQNRKDIKITIDPSYNGVAYAGGGQIVISAAWLRNNPEDYDVVTHEGMHIVQSYNRGDPGWLIEGIADYCRWKWGVNNGRAGWSLPDFQRGQHYTNAYRVTARFLVWLERKKNGNIVKQLDTALRSNTYSGNSWNSFAGQGVDQLWTEYSNNPGL